MEDSSKNIDFGPLRRPAIGIYNGKGTSHSWLWFVDLLERFGFCDLRFIDEATLRLGRVFDLDALAVSGGDTFAVAKALGAEGADFLKKFIEKGGLYIGSCAGAYLPMNSSKPPLDLFNFAAVKITNLSGILPKAEAMSDKYCTAYGCRYIFHPVRETVRLKLTGIAPFNRFDTVAAPMYGGPAMSVSESEETEILARYEGFTKETLFLVSPELAAKTMLGNAAAVRVRLGKGCMYLFGPHFEHPRFSDANRMVIDVLMASGVKSAESRPPIARPDVCRTGREAIEALRGLKREISNSRIVSTGLEMSDTRWRIGEKIYNPEKFRVFLDAVWVRIKRLEKERRLCDAQGRLAQAVRCAAETTRMMRELKQGVDRKIDTTPLAAAIIERLHEQTTAFLEIYFATTAVNRQASRA